MNKEKSTMALKRSTRGVDLKNSTTSKLKILEPKGVITFEGKLVKFSANKKN